VEPWTWFWGGAQSKGTAVSFLYRGNTKEDRIINHEEKVRETPEVFPGGKTMSPG
jgi:hypothetical protein